MYFFSRLQNGSIDLRTNLCACQRPLKATTVSAFRFERGSLLLLIDPAIVSVPTTQVAFQYSISKLDFNRCID